MSTATTPLTPGVRTRPVAGAGPTLQRWASTIGAPLAVLAVVLAAWQFWLHQPQVPPPSDILEQLGSNRDAILKDMRVTFWEEALRGYVAGCGLGFLAGVLCARFPWLQRGILPYAVLSNSLPIVAAAPIFIFWFGFDWPSKFAVVVVMTFFPMLINTVVGLTSYNPLSRDLLTSYAASSWRVFRSLQLPNALPMIFNGLKICSTLSVIGATVAEYFSNLGTGLGTQIEDSASAATWALLWACVLVACLVGIAFYGVLLLLERTLTFWHVSYRTEE